ncbi:hypothetical protein PT974_04667 [Cladobotryum mycophilum]|uniref:GH16 domain-containing protein n=1 Tax=Cladobotryum mycophilum TaxID=491253 RepID=A0ABR0SVK3_9HYPO
MNSFFIRYPLMRVLAILVVASFVSAEGSELAEDSMCDCFLINGTVPTYYTNHMFFDFRGLSNYAGVPDLIKDETLASSAPPSSDFFANKNWTDIWNIQTWDNSLGEGEGYSNDGGVLMVNSRSNVFIESNKDQDAVSETYLTLRTKRLPGFQTASEFQSVDANFHFVSMRMLARTVGSAGAVTGMFTYRDATGKLADVQESDVEILTGGPRNKIQYTNQPSYTDDGRDIPEATRNATTPDWSDWVVHRLDWTPKQVIWYVNGENVTSIEFQTPREATDLHFSAWSDGGTWSGNMSLNNEASQHVQWIEVLYNTTDKNIVGGRSLVPRKKSEKKCKVVCSIDESTEVGKAAILWESGSMRMSANYGLGGWVIWMTIFMMGVSLLR